MDSPTPTSTADLVGKLRHAASGFRSESTGAHMHVSPMFSEPMLEAATLIETREKHYDLLRQSFETRGELIENDPFPLWMQVVASFDHMRDRALSAEAALETQGKEIERLTVALVDSVHRMHSEPQHMLCRGLQMLVGWSDTFGVGFRSADGEWHEVNASRAQLDAVTAALNAEDERRKQSLAALAEGPDHAG